LGRENLDAVMVVREERETESKERLLDKISIAFAR
jgi:hypothetical protein